MGRSARGEVVKGFGDEGDDSYEESIGPLLCAIFDVVGNVSDLLPPTEREYG